MRRHELSDHEWSIIQPLLPNKPRGVPRVRHAAHMHCCMMRVELGAGQIGSIGPLLLQGLRYFTSTGTERQ